jgi:hypothetical protein
VLVLVKSSSFLLSAWCGTPLSMALSHMTQSQVPKPSEGPPSTGSSSTDDGPGPDVKRLKVSDSEHSTATSPDHCDTMQETTPWPRWQPVTSVILEHVPTRLLDAGDLPLASLAPRDSDQSLLREETLCMSCAWPRSMCLCGMEKLW